MNTVPYYVIAFILATFVASYYSAKLLSFKLQLFYNEKTRISTVDGLRGYLALMVFAHHSVITYEWKRRGAWAVPSPNIFEGLGSVPVSLFFMITGFLFIGKIMTAQTNINWRSLYIGRIFRIYPLYLFSLLLIYLVAAIRAESLPKIDLGFLAKDIAPWLTFRGNSALGWPWAGFVVAGVFWSLLYEAIFYLLLPAIQLIVTSTRILRVEAIVIYPALCLICYVLYNWHPAWIVDIRLFVLFIIGGICSLAKRYFDEKIRLLSLMKSNSASAICVIVFVLSLLCVNYSTTQFILAGLVFLIVSNGNSIFGLLDKRVSYFLGEISYGIYLLHGFFLYFLYSILSIPVGSWSGFEAKQFLLAPLLIISCYVAHVLIEVRGMRHGRMFAKKLDTVFVSQSS